MRRIALLTLALLALAPMALATHGGVHITDSGYDPATITIAPGGQVTFVYDNVLGEHGADFTDPSITDCGLGSSVALTPDCPVDFPAAGRFTYQDPGCGSPCSFTGVVNVDGPATADFTWSPDPQRRGEPVVFDATAIEPGGTIASYAWDFGDGATSIAEDPSHAYAAAGVYLVKLTVEDDLGNRTTVQHDVVVFEPDDDADGVLNKDDLCPDVGAATPDGCPLPPPVPVVPGEIDVAQAAADTLSLEGLARDGITAVISCTGPCSASATLLPVSGIRIAQAPTAMATASGSLAGPGALKLSLKLTAAAKRALKKVKKSARLKLESTVTDALGRVKARTTSLTISRVSAARKLPQVGISDQTATTFSDPMFTVLRLRYGRLVTPWNAITAEPDRLDAWLQAARAAGVRPLVSFNARRGDLCPKRPCQTPTVRQYTKAFRAFRKKYPWVRDISPWNEANHGTQPVGKKPKLAAQFYNVVRRWCRGCRIVALDLLDQNNMRRYLVEFLKHVKGKPRLWGLHNYRDTNRFRDKGTSQLLKLVKGEVWLTETGGIVRFETQSGVVALPQSEKRARKAMEFMFKLGRKHSKRIKRVYVYQWRKNFAEDRFDAGVVTFEGKPRPSYDVLSLHASAARR